MGNKCSNGTGSLKKSTLEQLKKVKSQRASFNYKYNHVKINVLQKNIFKSKAQCIINPITSFSGDPLTQTNLTKELIKKGGIAMNDEFLNSVEESFPGDVFIISAGNLTFKYIISLTGGEQTQSIQTFRSQIKEILELCQTHEIQSMVLPDISKTFKSFSQEDIAMVLYEEIKASIDMKKINNETNFLKKITIIDKSSKFVKDFGLALKLFKNISKTKNTDVSVIQNTEQSLNSDVSSFNWDLIKEDNVPQNTQKYVKMLQDPFGVDLLDDAKDNQRSSTDEGDSSSDKSKELQEIIDNQKTTIKTLNQDLVDQSTKYEEQITVLKQELQESKNVNQKLSIRNCNIQKKSQENVLKMQEQTQKLEEMEKKLLSQYSAFLQTERLFKQFKSQQKLKERKTLVISNKNQLNIKNYMAQIQTLQKQSVSYYSQILSQERKIVMLQNKPIKSKQLESLIEKQNSFKEINKKLESDNTEKDYEIKILNQEINLAIRKIKKLENQVTQLKSSG